MPDIRARINQQNEIIASKVEVNTAGINLGDLTDVTITSPTDGSYVIYQTSSNSFLDDQTIVKTGTGITLTGNLVATGDIDVDGTLEADAITVNGITLAETISDTVGNMITDSNTESGIAVTYDDSDNTLDFNVDDFSITLTGDVTGSGTVTNLGNVSFATTIQAGSLENDMLAGSITNAKLSNSTVSYGGISLALGATDDTPAFNLQDATNLPTSALTGDMPNARIVVGNVTQHQSSLSVATTQLTGTITNTQLAGSITNDKLSNSTVNFGGVSVALGASDTTPAFDLQHATNLPTSALTGDMPNARIIASNVTQHQAALSVATSQLSGNITNAQLTNSSITVSDGSNTSPVALGGTLSFTGTSNEVTVAENAGTVTIGLPDDVTIAGDLSVADAPTAGAHVTNKTYVDAKVAALVDSAPEALDTLNELAVALGNDANYATTTASTIGEKLAKASNLSDLANTGTARTNLGLGTAATTAASAYATAAQGTKADSAIQSGDLATVATSGSYADLTNKPTLLTIGTSSTTALAGNTSLLALGTSSTTALAGNTSLLALGTSSTTALAGNTALFSGSYADLTNKPTLLTIGTSSTTALAGNTALLQIGTSSTTALAGNTSLFSGSYADLTNKPTLGTAAATASSDYAPAAGSSNIVTTGALNAGSITSGFTSIDIGSGALTAGATIVNGELTVNSDTLKLTSATASSTVEHPSLELYRNGGVGSGDLGAIRFFGNNNATTDGVSTPEKFQYAGIYASVQSGIDGAEQGSLAFSLGHSGAQEDPAMSLFSYGLQMGYGNPILMSYSNGYQQFFSPDAAQKSFKLNATPSATVANGAYDIYLPDVAGGTLVAANSDKAFTAGATTVNGALTVNSDLFEITSTVDDATEKPIISLYRDAGVPSTNDELGAIRWFGQNASDEKQFYGGIYAQADVITDGAHKGSLNFHLADGSNNGTAISDVLVDINGDEDPTMSLTSELLTVNANVLIQASASDVGVQATPTPILELFQIDGPTADDGDHLGEIQFTAYNDNGYSPAKHKYAGIHAEIIDETNATEDGSLHFTAITAGTEDTTVLTLNGTESTFTTPLVVTGGVTASQTIANAVTDTDISVSEFATYNGKKIIYTGGAGSVHLADAVAADIGKAWTIINAGTGAITINRATSTQTIKLLDGSSVSAGSANLTLATGGIIEIICTAADNYITFGSGVS
jgi:hypothetical protein